MTAPADRLLAAADLLDKRSGEATEGPWNLERRVLTASGALRYSIRGSRETVLDAKWASPDVRYIATMHPEVGKALAEWLRHEGMYVRQGEGRAFGGGDMTLPDPHALALADLLLAGEPQ